LALPDSIRRAILPAVRSTHRWTNRQKTAGKTWDDSESTHRLLSGSAVAGAPVDDGG
jgi:hypothetical protein